MNTLSLMSDRMFLKTLSFVVILALTFPATAAVNASTGSPFVGEWQSIDVDGGDVRLTIGGGPNGPFKVTWMESYFGICGGQAGIGRGTAWLNTEDLNLLQADLEFTCFTTGLRFSLYKEWRFDPGTGWLTDRNESLGGFVTTWHRPRETLPLLWDRMIAHPDEDWVEGLGFADGTVVSLAIYDSNHNQLFLGTGVASPMEWDPNNTWVSFGVGYDLKAGDHLWMSDGMVAKDLIVTNLAITDINYREQSVSGIAQPGSAVAIEYETGEFFWINADASGLWTTNVSGLLPWKPGMASQEDADGDMTRVVFVTNTRIVAGDGNNFIWTVNFAAFTDQTISIYESKEAKDSGADPLWQGTKTGNQEGFVLVESNDHGLDLLPGNYVVVTDGAREKSLVLEAVTADIFDVKYETMSGTAPAGRNVWVAAGPQDWQVGMYVSSDALTGAWKADFTTIPFDLTDEMQPWSYAQLFDEDGDANEGDFPPLDYWAVVYTSGPETWDVTDGKPPHVYHFESTWLDGGEITPQVEFNVSDSADPYPGYVLMRGLALRGFVDGACPAIDPPVIRPDQPTLFHMGYVTDYAMTYAGAVAYFDSLSSKVVWDTSEPVELQRGEMINYNPADWSDYVCSFTNPDR